MSLQHLTSSNNSSLIVEVGMRSGGAAQVADQRKHIDNGKNCRELDWNNIPLAVELYGAWVKKPHQSDGITHYVATQHDTCLTHAR